MEIERFFKSPEKNSHFAPKQYEMAVNLIDELLEFIPELSDELNAELLLDALGCAGLSLTVGEYASQTFVARLHG